MKKENYLAPTLEVIKMENEGVIATSTPGVGDGGSAFSTSYSVRRTNSYGTASESEFEDLIEDILSPEQ